MLPSQTHRWVEKQLAMPITAVTQLTGATSSTIYKIDVNKHQSFVLRRHTLTAWLAVEPDLARHEAVALQWLAKADVPVPELVAYDEFGAETDVPAILTTFLPGKIELQPANLEQWLQQMAQTLFAIHTLSGDDFGWEYFPYNELAELKVPAWSSHPDLWQRAITILNNPPAEVANTPTCLIHRDYHPGNILFENGVVSGVVDFPNTCRGVAGLDVGHCRNNLAHLFGVTVADQFLRAYEGVAGNSFTYHPYWDLITLSDWLPGEPGVYAGWVDNGVCHLTPTLMRQRRDAYFAGIMQHVM